MHANSLANRKNELWVEQTALREAAKALGCAHAYADGHKCTNVTIELDHIDPKTKTKGKQFAKQDGWVAAQFEGSTTKALQAYRAELEKCQPLCRGHHRDKTVKDRCAKRGGGAPKYTKQQQRSVDFLREEKLRIGVCQCDAKCGKAVSEETLMHYDWAHNNFLDKLHTVSQMLSYSMENLQKELAKCRLLHFDCHHKETHGSEMETRRRAPYEE